MIDSRGKDGKFRKRRDKIHLIVRKADFKEPAYDYLKFFPVVIRWVKAKHDLSLSDVYMLMFLYTERLFSREDFEDYAKIFSWEEERFNRLLRDGWISKWRTQGKQRTALYNLSPKGKRVMSSMYRKLNGTEDFSEVPAKNPVMKRKSFSHKTLSSVMKMINKRNKERRLTATRRRKDEKR